VVDHQNLLQGAQALVRLLMKIIAGEQLQSR
jgi:hypothetical protein